MIYILLDTNIYLSSIVNRRKSQPTQIDGELLGIFNTLLNYGDIKLLIPNIVIDEVNRHLENELQKIKNIYADIKKSLSNAYWFNISSMNRFDYNIAHKAAQENIQTIIDHLEENNERYLQAAGSLFNDICTSINSIKINELPALYNKVMQRIIYKKAPCHVEDKVSYADALIIEILLNIGDYLPVKEDDTFFFISENYKDFAVSKGIEQFHPTIMEDVKAIGMDGRLTYKIRFGQFIKQDLSQQVESAGLIEELERTLAHEQDVMLEMARADYEENIRESLGISTLSGMDDRALEVIFDSDYVCEILALFEQINETYNDLYNMSGEFDDFYNDIGKIAINRFNDFLVNTRQRYFCYTQDDIKDWINTHYNILELFDCKLDDYMQVNEEYSITQADTTEATLKISGYLTPLDDVTDEVIFTLHANDNVVKDTIEVYYGYAESDSFEGTVDGAQDEIRIPPLDESYVIPKLQKILDALLELRDKYQTYTDTIQSLLDSTPATQPPTLNP